MSSPDPVVSDPAWARFASARRYFLALVLLAVVAVFSFGYAIRGNGVETEKVHCLSAEGTISCELSDDWTIAVPLDVAWTETSGTFHAQGRPECLPPTGLGLEDPVLVSWTEVDIDGRAWRQVLHVECLS